MAQKSIPRIPSQLFVYSPKTKIFSTEASEIQKSFRLDPTYDAYDEPIYDVCDQGFIAFPKGGKEVEYQLSDIKKNETSILSWNFVCVTSGFTHLKAVIFNDVFVSR